MKKLFHTALIFILFSYNGWSQYDFSSVTKLINDSISIVGPNCGLVIIRNDSIIYKKYFGSWNDDTYQPIASGSKMPSMALIMTLVDEGLLSLDDTVQKYLSSFSGKPVITLRQLMSHTSGLPENSPFINDNSLTLKQAVDSIGLKTLMSTYSPGTAFQYGGVSMHVAGRIAEIVSGMRWDSLFIKKFSQPLSLKHTDYLGLGATTNYRIAGGMGTTLPDYIKLLSTIYHYGNYNGVQLLDTSSVIEMQTDQTNGVPLVSTPYENNFNIEYRYGFGLWLDKINPDCNKAIIISDQGAFGFSPWIDRCRNMMCIFYVRKTLSSIQPTQLALRNLIQKIVPLSLKKPLISTINKQLHSNYPTGNQWFLNDVAIPGATKQNYTPSDNGSYSVKTTDFNGCDAVSEKLNYSIPNDISVQLNKKEKQLSIYPNPFSVNTRIEFPYSINSNYKLIIRDNSGKVIRIENKIESNSIILEKENIPSGVYIIELQGDKIYREKLIIK